MSIEFPAMLYKDRGPYQRLGGSFSIVVVNSQQEYESCISKGMAPHPDLIGKEPVVDDNLAPTREEMEEKAHELGLKFDGRTSDKKLMAMIDFALSTKE